MYLANASSKSSGIISWAFIQFNFIILHICYFDNLHRAHVTPSQFSWPHAHCYLRSSHQGFMGTIKVCLMVPLRHGNYSSYSLTLRPWNLDPLAQNSRANSPASVRGHVTHLSLVFLLALVLKRSTDSQWLLNPKDEPTKEYTAWLCCCSRLLLSSLLSIPSSVFHFCSRDKSDIVPIPFTGQRQVRFC